MGRPGVKLLAVTVVVELGIALGVVACGDNPTKEVKAAGATELPPPTSPPAATAAPVAPEVGDKVPVGNEGGSVAVLAVEADVNAGRLFPAPKGKQYYAAQVEACAGAREFGLSFDPSYFILQMGDDGAYNHGLPVKKPDLAGGPLPAGDCSAGWVTFVVPDDAKGTGVVYDGSSRITWRIPPEPVKTSR